MEQKVKKPSVSGILWTILEIILIIIIAVLIFFLLSNLGKDGTKLNMPLGFGCAVIMSGSMEPALSVDDLVIIKESDSYTTGDVVIYCREDSSSMTIHRIISMDPDTGVVITQGDANNVADDPITVSDIQGKMIYKIAGAGKVLTFLKNPVVLVLLIGILFLLIILPGGKRDKRESS